MLDSVVNAFRIADLRAKLLFTFGMLVAFRFLSHVPVPGVDSQEISKIAGSANGFIVTGGIRTTWRSCAAERSPASRRRDTRS